MSVHISITRDTATAAVTQLTRNIGARAVAEKLAAPLELLVKGNFEAQPANKQGWPSTGFWANASRATTSRILDDGLLLSCNQIGVRLRYYGGDIHAGVGTSSKTGQPTKYLAIAARAEAYGKNPSEFNDLVPVFRRINGQLKAIGLAQAQQTQVQFGRQRKDGSRGVKAQEKGGDIMYWLKETIHQKANPNVLPTDQQFYETIDKALSNLTRS